jgi:hypothetical protein
MLSTDVLLEFGEAKGDIHVHQSNNVEPTHGCNTKGAETEAHETHIKHEDKARKDVIHKAEVDGDNSCKSLTLTKKIK